MGSSQQTIVVNQQLPNTKTKGFSSIYRKKNVQKLRETPDPSVQTLNDLINHTVTKYGDKKGIGYVAVATDRDEKGEEVEVRSVKEFTYREFYQMSYNLGKALVNRGLFSVESHHRMKLIGIFSKNRYEWLASDWACILFGLTTVPLYDTLGVENISYCLNQTEMTTIFATSATIKILFKLKDIGRLNTIISYDDLDGETINKLRGLNIRVVLFSELVKEGQSLKHITNKDVKVSPRSCYTFSYTSGTTGPPKGAMISHLNALSFVTGLHYQNDLHFTSEDVYISYLPLPHVMERTIFSAMCYEGATFVVASGNVLKLKDDCAIIKPTILMSVPRLYNRIVEGTKAKFQSETGLKKCLIDCGINSKLQSAKEEGTYTHSFYDSIIFNKVRDSFGGKIRILGSGSAPLSSDANMFMKAIMCAPLIQGYGQTQSTAGFLFSRGLDSNYGVLASLAETSEVKLCEIPEMKYTADDRNQDGVSTPRGELWLRGSNVFMGYYKLQELTKETITHDGWLKTGDIVEVNSQTLSFKLIDRRKNIFKLSQGEYVAPDKVENLYLGSQLITEVFVHGQSAYHFAVVIVTPNKEKLQALAATKEINGTFEELCRNKQLKTYVLIELNNLAKKGGLHGFEQAKNIFIDPEGFGPKNILTNTMKLIRFQARKAYKPIIELLYKQGELALKE